MNDTTDLSVVLISWCPAPADYRLGLLRETVASLRECTEIAYQFVCVDNGGAEQTEYLRTV